MQNVRESVSALLWRKRTSVNVIIRRHSRRMWRSGCAGNRAAAEFHAIDIREPIIWHLEVLFAALRWCQIIETIDLAD